MVVETHMGYSISKRVVSLIVLVVAALSILFVGLTAQARPAGFIVVNPGDSIQAAIASANDGDVIVIHAGTYVNRYTMFDAHLHLEVGRDCMIGPYCYFTDANHGMADGESVKSQDVKAAPVIIEDEVWIGAGVMVLAGVRIGRGAVVGAGSVVTRDLSGNAVAVGVPARQIRTRT